MIAPQPPEGLDQAHMRTALWLAARGLGRVWPNPAVGCVLVRQGHIVGRGWTQPTGRPHAETQALAQAGAAAAGSDAYVTLEPCAHHGRTPPCADALVAAGITRCVVATADPDPRVNGQGIARLREAGIVVVTDVLADQATWLNEGFLRRVRQGRPMVTLKLATSLDGRLATATGDNRWITGPAARQQAHRMRAQHDAILIGVGTAIADDPELTCRLPGMTDRSPVRVIMDSRLRLPLTSRLVATAQTTPTWVVTLQQGADPQRVRAFEQCGVKILAVPASTTGALDIWAALGVLAEQGITRVLAEGGAALATSLLQADLVDRLEWFRSPAVIGGDGLAAVSGLQVQQLVQAARFVRGDVVALEQDIVESLYRPLASVSPA